MNRWNGLALFLAMAVLFLIANRGAYKGYFQDDELDNLGWTRQLPVSDFAKTLVTPLFLTNNFRPVGHFYYYVMGRRFGLDFPKYLIPIHALHFLNVWLVWLLARRLGAGAFAASAGALFFAFHMAVFDAYWKPMYVFDVACATFCLAAILLYARGRWVLSFLAFWLAYKSKELAVMLPAVLACYEFWFGQKRWKPLAPFFLLSLSFGLQGLALNPHKEGDYAFSFTPGDIFKTISFYAGKIFLVPFAGFVLLAAPLLVRDRRVWFGLAALFLFFFPLLFLPGRLFGAYCYVPLIGAALALAGMADRQPRALLVAFFLLWIPWNIHFLRLNRRQTLTADDDVRRYVSSLAEFARISPATSYFLYDGAPFAFNHWGTLGALRCVYGRYNIQLSKADEPIQQAVQPESVAILSWNPVARKLSIASRSPGALETSYIAMSGETPVWQLVQGWYPLEGGFRWIQPVATARLQRPEHARQFELRVNMNPLQIQALTRVEVSLSINGQPAGSREFTTPGWLSVRWDLAPAGPGRADVRFQVQPPFRPSMDSRTLGVAVAAFGFLPAEDP